MSNSDRRQRVEELLHQALTVAPEERLAVIRRSAANDEGLIIEVEALLIEHQRRKHDLQDAVTETDGSSFDLLGHSLGHYRILAPLGKGGMGEVYLAEDDRLGRRVALKILPGKLSSKADRLLRFKREARAISALNHPNILTVFEVDEVQGIHFMATEYVEGKTLRGYLARQFVGLSDAIEIAMQVARALAAAHAAGIIHRDIKPENIMLRPDGLVKVLDFGLAKLTESPFTPPTLTQPNSALSIPGVILGTPAYMSPEQACGREIGPASDLFSLGVVLFEMIAGRPPFTGANSSEVLAAILKSDPPRVAELRPGVPAALDTLVTRALAKNVEDRYQTADSIQTDLKATQLKLSEIGSADSAITLGRSLNQTYQHELGYRADSNPRVLTKLGSLGFSSMGRILTSGARSLEKLVREHRVFSIGLVVVMLAGLGAWLPRLTGRAEAIDSLVVLPMVNETGNAELEYVTEGLTDNLIDGLARLPRLRVISRSSASRFRSQPFDAREIGRRLDVEAIVTGRVIRRDGNLVVSVELVDSGDSRRLWSTQIERGSETLAGSANELVTGIAAKIGGEASKAVRVIPAHQPAPDGEAYRLYLLGRSYWNKRTEADLRRSAEFFQRAVDRQPDFAPAYAGLAAAYIGIGANYDFSHELFSKSKDNAIRAINIDPDLADAHYALAAVHYAYEWDWGATERELKTTLAQNPNLVAAHTLYSNLLRTLDRGSEALVESRRAVQLDPLSVLANTNLGHARHFLGEFDDGDEQFRRVLELDPQFAIALEGLAWTEEQRGQYENAKETLKKALAIEPENSSFIAAAGRVAVGLGRVEEARQSLATLIRLSRKKYVSPVDIADVYQALGERDLAFEQLELGYQTHCPALTSITDKRRLRNLRSDRRFAALLKQMNIPL